MHAAVLHAPGDIRTETVRRPTPAAGELLIEVAACGVCGSDIPRVLHTGAHRLPLVCGHEFSGHVVDAGDDVDGFASGELVTVPPLIPCFACEQCARGSFSLCDDYDYFGSRRDGAYAEYVTVPVTNAMKVPAGLDPQAAAMADPAAIALHAIWRGAPRIGDRVAIVGCGPIGLFAIQWARIAGARDVLAVDVSPASIELAEQAGATATASNDDDATAHGGFDLVVEAAGAPAAEDLAVRLVRAGGRAAFVGIPHAPVTWSKRTFEHFLRREVTVHGAWNSFSAPFPGDEWRVTLDAMASGTLSWEFMITHRLGLDALPETFGWLGDRSQASSKVLFLPNHG